MAARRLVLLMLVLLFASSLAAALAPVQPTDEEETTPATTAPPAPPAPDPPGAAAGVVEARLDAEARRPRTVAVAVGDELRLRVASERRPVTITMPGLGASDNAGPSAPARFDLILREPGELSVRVLGSDRIVGLIEVSREARPGRPPARAGDRPAGR